MKLYKLSELKENTLYRCVLSQKPVLIESFVKGYKTKAMRYNSVTGEYISFIVSDNMLTG